MKTLMVSALLALLIPAPAAGRSGAARRGAERGCPGHPAHAPAFPGLHPPGSPGSREGEQNPGGGGEELSACFLLFVLLVVWGFCVCLRFKERIESRYA